MSPSSLRRWHTLASPRERALVVLGGLLVAGTLLWALLLDPLSRDLAETERSVLDARVALEHARLRADELAQLAKTRNTGPAGDARATVERIVAERGLRPALTALQAREGRVELTFESIELVVLTSLVEAIGRDAQLFPVEALLAARTTPGSVRAEIAFGRAPP